MIIKIEEIIHIENDYVDGYAYLISPPELQEESIFLKAVEITNKNKAKYIKHYVKTRTEFESKELIDDPSGIPRPHGKKYYTIEVYIEVDNDLGPPLST